MRQKEREQLWLLGLCFTTMVAITCLVVATLSSKTTDRVEVENMRLKQAGWDTAYELVFSMHQFDVSCNNRHSW